MFLHTVIALLPIQLIGLASLGYGIVRIQRLVRLLRTGRRISAAKLPDDAAGTPAGFADTAPAIYRRVARFDCPVTGRRRCVAESVASSRQSPWMPGERIPVIVSPEPPHEAVVATFRNLYLFPLVFLAAGVGLAVLLPFAILLKR